MNLTTTKIVVAFLFAFIRFFFGVLPVKLYKLLRHWEEDDDSETFINAKRHAQINCAIALCQSFGGGVLFATCFLHMMVDVYKSVEELKKYEVLNTDYPMSQLIVCCGFFLVYFVEEISHWAITQMPNDEVVPNDKKHCISSKLIPSGDKKNKISPMKDQVFIIENFNKVQPIEKEVKIIDEKNEKNEKLLFENEETLKESLKERLSSAVLRENKRNLSMDDDIDEESKSISEELNEAVPVPEESKEVKKRVFTQQQVMRFILVEVALSLHASFEGLAIGIQHDVNNIWYLFLAVCIHSATILFCIGLEMLMAKASVLQIYAHMSILALASPFGVILGLLISIDADMNTKARSTAVVLLEGISTGTIVYITFFEVLNREKHRRVFRIRRAACILAGFSLMAGLQYLEIK